MPKAAKRKAPKATPGGTESNAKLERVEVRAYANSDDVLIVWRAPVIPECRGFAVYRKAKGTDAEVLDNRVGWENEKPQKDRKTSPSTKWPFQLYRWCDYKARSGQVLSYRIIPMVGKRGALKPADSLASDWTREITVTSNAAGDPLRVFFNRGIVASQWLARVLIDEVTGTRRSLMDIIADQKSKTRQFLAGEIRWELLRLLRDVRDGDGHVFCALFELNDPDLLEALLSIGGRAHLVLANGSPDTKKKEILDPYAEYRQKLRDGGVDVHDRISKTFTGGFLAHNKFAVVTNSQKDPLRVWSGSTNWSMTGLCTQNNNAILIDDSKTATFFMKRWNDLRKAGDGRLPRSTAALATPVGGLSVRIWFSPTKAQPELVEARKLINGAREGVLFLMFNPGPTKDSLLRTILDLIDEGSDAYRPELFVAGALNQDPGTKQKPVLVVTRGEQKTAPIEAMIPEAIQKNFAWWIKEIKKAPNARAMVHSKVIVVDPFGAEPKVITGSHNFSKSASGNNDENFIVISGDRDLAISYSIGILNVYSQYRFRQSQIDHEYGGLVDNDTWQTTYLGPRRLQERNFWFAGT